MTNAPTTRETADHAELAAIISDEEIARVHGHANFGPSITPREVVNDGVRKYAVGYHSGYTQLTILLEHGLITRPRPGRYDANLTKKGKKYARVLYRREDALLSEIAALRGERDEWRETVRFNERCWSEERGVMIDRFTQAERQRDEARDTIASTVAKADWMQGHLSGERSSIDRETIELVVSECRAYCHLQALANQGADQ